MKNLLFLIIVIPILIPFISGCSNEPGKVGVGLVSPSDTLSVTTLELNSYADSSFVYRYSGTPHIFVGKYSASGTAIESNGLLQFSGLTNVPDSALIDSAYITLHLNYAYPDTIGDIRFGIYEMIKGWNQSTFTWDSLADSYDPTAKYAFQNSFTGLRSINIPIDSLVHKWVKNKTNSPNGILLKPALDGSNVIVGTRINSFVDTISSLTVAYRIPGDDSIKHFSTNAVQSTFVSNGNLIQEETKILVQGSIGQRGRLLFDLSMLPKRISITRAIIQLTTDTTYPLANIHTHDSLIVHLIRKSVYPYDSTALGTLCVPSIKDGQKIYTADIKSIVQTWLVREPNNGLLIRPYSENYSFDQFAIFNNKSEWKLQPKLFIIYTILP
ncbi:MAG: DNRLRE domain-containing protein [Ignavibacteriales bacterium]|nr:DNRLRE domain-containing protein [Ignavibacteriales bacterium]